MRNNTITKISTLSMFLALAVLLNYVESFFPTIVPIPGVKLGLANTMNLILLYFFGRKEYFSIGFLRVLLMSVMFTGLFTNGFFLSMSGFLLSSIVVLLLSINKNFSIFSLSVASAVFHGIGQIICAVILNANPDGTSIYLFSYLRVLVVSSIITGTLIALLSSLTIERLEKTSVFKNF